MKLRTKKLLSTLFIFAVICSVLGVSVISSDAKVEEAITGFKTGTLNVFDTANFTVEGKNLDSYMADVDTDANYEKDTEVIADGYFHESEFRSAPYFDLNIDGITLLNSMF